MHPIQAGGLSDLPRKIRNYRIEERLGSGGMGVVYRAFDEALERPLAIKHLLSSQANPAAARRFRREAQTAARLNHPAIVHIYDIVEAEDGDWIVMELVEGQTLACRMRQQKLDLLEVVQLGREVAQGLAEAHAHGIIHRDLKAGNVMVTPGGRAKILDFGLAKFLQHETDLSQTGIVFGTCHAMSPEQAQGLPLDHRSDLFSLGSLLYEMATGSSPFRASTIPETLLRICSVLPAPAWRVRPDVPRELSELIDQLLSKDPADRIQSAAEVARRLGEIAQALRPAAGGGGGTRVPADSASSILPIAAQDGASTMVDGLLAGRELPLPPVSPDPSRLSSERRQVTVVCCELAPTGEDSGALDPETLHELMLQIRSVALGVAGRHGGHLESALGHRMLVYFGYPQTYEDNARRAALTALELVEEVARMKAGSDLDEPLRPALRVGIHIGQAVVATHPHSPGPVMLGATLDLAIQLPSLARPGEVVVSPAIGSLIQKSFSLEPLPPVSLAGLSAPWTLLRLLGAVHSSEENPVELLPLVGRDRELDLLLGRWSLACEGTGQVVLISGEAGIGKSRLVQALRERLGDAVKWLSCGGSPYTLNSPLRPIVDLLRHAVSLREGAAPLDRLESLLRDHALEEALPLFAALLDLPLGERYAAPSLSPERQREKTLDALAAWVTAMAERQPLVLLIEDLHWLDPTTLDWLGRLSDQALAAPLFLVLTLRLHSGDANWGPRAHWTQITLDPLTDSAAKALIDQVAGASSLPVEVRRQIVARTDGVPLFLEELTKTALETSGSGERRDLPATLRDSLAARLDRLSTAKEIAQLASAIGREFTLELLAAVSSQDEAMLHQDLKQLIQAGLLYRKGFGAQARYIFKHALVQDAAYDSLLKRERQQIHRQIAQTLETRFPEIAETQPELIAHHYTEAGSTEAAIDGWYRAGVLAGRRSASLEAISHLDRALQMLETLPESPERDRRELKIQNSQAAAVITGRGYLDPKVERSYARMEVLAEHLLETEERFWAVLGLHIYHVVFGNFVQAQHLAERLLRIAESDGSPRLLSIACFSLGSHLYWQCRYAEALIELEKAYELAPPDDDSYRIRTGADLRVLALSHAALTLWHLGQPEQARHRREQAIALARQLGSPFTLAFACVWGAVLAHCLRDVEGVHRMAREIHDVAEELGYYLWAWQTTFLLAWADLHAPVEGRPAIELGDFASSQRVIAQNSGGAMAYYFSLHAEILIAQGRPGDARQALDEALRLVQERGAPSWNEEIYRLQGEILLGAESRVGLPDAGGRTDEAERLFHAALEQARSNGSRSLELRAALCLGRLWQGLGRTEDARVLVARACRDLFEDHDVPDLRAARSFLDSCSIKET